MAENSLLSRWYPQNTGMITAADWSNYAERAQTKLVTRWRLCFALALIVLEFSNLMQFATFGSRDLFHSSGASVHVSTYSLQALGYLMFAVVSILAPGSLRKLVAQPIFRWTIVALAVFTWGMLVRAFNPPAGLPDYFVLREFLLRLNALGFLLTCVLMFEGESVLRAVKRAVVLATLLAVAVNICEIMHLWVFSATPTDWNRAMGLQDDPNAAGMVIVFGCVIGLTEVPRRFRELFIVACAAGIVPTFSREAMGAFAVLILCASLGRALSTPRLLIIVSLAIVAIFAWNLSTILDRQGILTDENLGRLTMQVSDASAQDHARIAQKVWHQFELAPLIGNGFGTTAYWNDNQSHNLYLSFMADHGILGVLLVPALVWCLAYGSWDYYAFAFGFLIWCMFNHNLFANPFGILTLAIMANQQAYFRSSLVPRFQFRSVVTY